MLGSSGISWYMDLELTSRHIDCYVDPRLGIPTSTTHCLIRLDMRGLLTGRGVSMITSQTLLVESAARYLYVVVSFSSTTHTSSSRLIHGHFHEVDTQLESLVT